MIFTMEMSQQWTCRWTTIFFKSCCTAKTNFVALFSCYHCKAAL